MKEVIKLKDFLISIIISFIFSFMLVIYEPIVAYATNVSDYWFSFKVLLTNNTLLFIILFFSLVFISFITYIISKKTKKYIVFRIYLTIYFICFIATYIQGNYLAGSLPILNGSPIKWNDYTIEKVISALLWIVVIAINIILIRKFKNKYTSLIKYISLAVFAMLSVSLISILLTKKEVYTEKGGHVSTTDNLNNISTNKNFLMLVIDTVDSKTFSKVLKETNKEELLKDFTYYPDTISTYSWTRESIPFILTGEWYTAQDTFSNYYNNAMNNSKLFEKLRKEGYDINIYEGELYWTDKKALEINNIEFTNFNIDKIKLFKEEFKYLMFKYLPFNLKKYSNIASLDYTLCRKNTLTIDDFYKMGNSFIYNHLDTLELQDNNYFQFLHIEGGHLPWDTNKNFETIANGTYEDKLEASITVLEKYINRLKESGQYDNSVIMIMSDHGNNGYDYKGRQNPILYIKGINETNKKMKVSNKKVSYEDLNDSIYDDLLAGKKNDELLVDVDKNRKRRFILFIENNIMYEQILDGHAWETDKLKFTGKKYVE